MAVFFTAVLVCSCAGLVALLLVKRWEMQTGRILFARVRPRLSSVLHTGLHGIEHILPSLMVLWLERGYEQLRHAARIGLAKTLVAVEEKLEHVLHALRRNPPPDTPPAGTASEFLREVADYKKKLVRRSRSKKNIVE